LLLLLKLHIYYYQLIDYRINYQFVNIQCIL